MTVTINGSTGITTPGQSNTGNSTVSGVATFATTIGVGNAAPASTGAGVTFPASQSSSSNANTLDDYEEGTWTPTDASGAGLTFTANGYYTKIGNTVSVQGYVAFPSNASGTSSQIGGLPFTSAGQTNQYSTCMCWTNSGLLLSAGMGSGTAFQPRTTSNGAQTNSSLSNYFLIFSFTYMAS